MLLPKAHLLQTCACACACGCGGVGLCAVLLPHSTRHAPGLAHVCGGCMPLQRSHAAARLIDLLPHAPCGCNQSKTLRPLNPVCGWCLQVRSVRSVTSVCQDRALSLATHINAKHEVDAKKVSIYI